MEQNYYSLFQLEAFVNRHTHGTGASQVKDFLGSCDDGRVALIGKVRPPEMVRKMQMEQALYDQVDRYTIPQDLKYSDIIELKKVSAKRNVDTLDSPLMVVYRRRFDQKRQQAKNVVAIFNENGLKYAKVNHPKGLKECQHLLINSVNSLTANGTWNVGGNVVNLRLDQLNHVTKIASIAFDINNSSNTGFIQNFGMQPVDITEYLNTGAVFEWLRLTVPKGLISVQLTMGSDITDITNDLYRLSVNQPHDSNVFTADWNLLKFEIDQMQIVGNPNPGAISWFQIEFSTDGITAMPNNNIDNLVARKGVVYEMTYNGSYIFMDSVTRAFKKFPTSGNDLIVAEEDTWNVFAWEVTKAVASEAYGNGAGSIIDVNNANSELGLAYQTYYMEHPSEAILQQDTSYVFGNAFDGMTDQVEWSDGYGDGDGGFGY